MKAWIILHEKWDGVHVVAAATRGKALAYLLNAARDSGYDKVKWGDFKARRAPRFDPLVTVNCCTFPLGYHSKSYDLDGITAWYDQWGCLDGERRPPKKVYHGAGAWLD